uniref:RING-type E3 ubiquitin transferase n=1 Tax=Latimeria chalumnae TaxID=7897 RepID=H3BBI9_LATCH
WHQYDDIICAPPPEVSNLVQWVKSKFNKKDVKKGREIAGKAHLEAIFGILTPWNEENLERFLNQLNQFCSRYKEPWVYEGVRKKWNSLQFGEKEIIVLHWKQTKELLREILTRIAEPHLGGDAPREKVFVKQRLRAGALLLFITTQFQLELKAEEVYKMCDLLCLQNKPKEALIADCEDLVKTFPATLNISVIVSKFCRDLMNRDLSKWVLLIPLLHLAKGSCKPFDSPPLTTNMMSLDNWAGLEGIEFTDYRRFYIHRDLLKMMIEHQYLMEVDRILPRSWFCLIGLEHLTDYISAVRLSTLDVLSGLYHRASWLKILGHLQNKLNDQKDRLKAHVKRVDFYVYAIFLKNKVRKSCLDCSVKIYEKLCKAFNNDSYREVPLRCISLVRVLADLAEDSSSKRTGDQSQTKGSADIVKGLHNLLKNTREWMKNIFKLKLLFGRYYVNFQNENEIKIWNQLISLEFGNEDFTSHWKETLLNDLKGRITQESENNRIEIYCQKNEEILQLHHLVRKCFEDCALEAVQVICQKNSEGELFKSFEKHGISKFGSLISKIIENSWPKSPLGKFEDNNDQVIQHLLGWSAAENIFKLQETDENIMDHLTKEANMLLSKAEPIFLDITKWLMDRTIKVQHLQYVLKKRENFLRLYKIKRNKLKKENSSGDALMKQALMWRENELRTLEREKGWVESLLKMCRKTNHIIKVDVEELERKHRENLGSKSLNEVVEVEETAKKFPIVTYFDLNSRLKQTAKEIHTFRESYIFQLCWEIEAQKVAKASLEEEEDDDDDDEVVTMPLDELPEVVFEPCFESYTQIYRDIKQGTLNFSVVDSVFKDYKDRYDDLKKDLRIMHRLDAKDEGSWIEERVNQIRQYHQLHLAVESALVIMNIQKVLNLTGDFSILKTLLSITDTSKNLECQRLNCISSGLMEAKDVLQEINDPRRNCLQELGQRKGFVDWVKEALTDINELKVFVDLASISAGENDLDVDRVACFHDAVLGYSSLLYELKTDAGFSEFMACLKKLWKALESDKNLPKKMRDSARYLEWLKTVKESHGSVELSSLSLAKAINSKGIYNIGAKDKSQLSLDAVLWLDLPEKHEDCSEIRHYTLDDLRELQNKLMLMSGKGDQGQQDVDWFSEVFSNVQRLASSFIDLYSAGNLLFRKWKASVYCSPDSDVCVSIDFNLGTIDPIKTSETITEQLPLLCRKMETYLENWKQFIDDKRSQLYYLNYYTADQLVHLCKNLYGVVNLYDKDEQINTMLSFIKSGCTNSDIKNAWSDQKDLFSNRGSSLTNDSEEELKTSDKMAKKLDVIWKCYMDNVASFQRHCFDIDTLGRFLAKLATLEKTTVRRDLLPGLHTGRPNLIVCPHSEVLSAAVSIYLQSQMQQLPTYDEVLLCTGETTYEQVELFLRRCLTPGYEGSKIYTMLHADELLYDVGYKAEQLFQKLQLHSGPKYQLVILCSSEREHCYIPSAFSQHKVHMVPYKPLKEIQEYLKKHYRVPKDIRTAASVFQERMFVGIVSSKRAGVGKSLFVKRLHKKLKAPERHRKAPLKTIRLIEPKIDESKVLKSLLDTSCRDGPMIFHLDVTSSVKLGLPEFLFKLLFLHYLMDSQGRMWKCSPMHLYIIEILEGSGPVAGNQPRASLRVPKYNFRDIFPKIICRAPKKVLELEMSRQDDPSQSTTDPVMDHQEFCSEGFQRPYQYLRRFYKRESLDHFSYVDKTVEGNHIECLQLFLIYCGVMDPSWSELRNFAWFLNQQLKDCETSVFCNSEFIGDVLEGFKNFVVNFMILMAKDFATPSLRISDQSPGKQTMNLDGVKEEDLAPFLMRKKWESEPHPYIFFNEDRTSMTFIGFHLQANSQGFIDAINPSNGTVIKKDVMTRQLYQGLVLQRVPFNIDFDSLSRAEKIERLCMVLGIQWPLDPDETYELTTDNILKILAIHMRFRCGIPVIIMGETGCGKTRLIKFLCELRRSGVMTDNMKLVKVHGGTTADMIHAKIREAEATAVINKEHYGFDTVLFFDEANTTEAVSSIKEVLCDQTVGGELLSANTGLQIIAACNPYRKHTEKMVKRLESAGLGYRVRADETEERLGSIPLRQLVYRVHALPPSMIPLVWDFGQLNDEAEKIYIQQIVQRLGMTITISEAQIKLITNVLSASQHYMRHRRDECSFVSLRDVERCMEVFKWFYNHKQLLFEKLEQLNEETKVLKATFVRDEVTWSLVLAVGVCYHASLERKDDYRKVICKQLPTPYDKPETVLQEITLIQDLLLSGVPLRDTIAKNSALKENVFMMVICIELKIPLFLVGKPGSSKSLAKTIVADAMQGQAAHSDLYKELKQIHLVSFQCSPHSTPEGIINTFRQCARFQEGKNLKEYVSVVVLDEIGLAEDSPKMPLKTLHPLLEDGCIDDNPDPHKKVGFIGISNWALDPAKMNRGIFVARGDPTKNELIKSANGICLSDPVILEKVKIFFKDFADAYLTICKKQPKEFFGLRDYYSLIKMVFAHTRATKKEPGPQEIAQAVLRNFSGLDNFDILGTFMMTLLHGEHYSTSAGEINTIELVRQNIESGSQDGECRYLLILTKNYAALQILQQAFFFEKYQPEIIFGSSFPKDQEYTQICRNINRVKICMETGRTVVLLNLQNLYESLYDALNQYYVYLGGQKYVDLGLGTHRVKCRVHQDFRLIVIEEKEVVYNQFPIPLINRLEKHYLDINTVLQGDHKSVVKDLEDWVNNFITLDSTNSLHGNAKKYSPPDVFVGYHSDTCASVVLQVTERIKDSVIPSEPTSRVLKEAKQVLLNCATPDSVVRLCNTKVGAAEAEHLLQDYFVHQKHISLVDFIYSHIQREHLCRTTFIEVTTFSRLLTTCDIKCLEKEVSNSVEGIEVLSLQQFDTELSFLKKIRCFLDASNGNKILIVQTDFENGSQSARLIASAKYSAINEINKEGRGGGMVFLYFITKLPRIEGGTSYVGFHGGPWQSVHIDDLRRSKEMVSDVTVLKSLTISQLFEEEVEDTPLEETIEVGEAAHVEEMVEEASNVEETMEVGEAADVEETTEGTERVLETTSVIRSCVQSAVGMLRDHREGSNRGTTRVEVLLTLLSEEDELKASFLKILKRRLHTLVFQQEQHGVNPAEWVVREASNLDALQEGGTFRHTLWKRIQAVITPFLGLIISFMDRDCNLDLLVTPTTAEFVKRLWINIFHSTNLLDISYTRVAGNSQSETILVQNHMKLNTDVACLMPFSWKIKDFMEDLRLQAQYIEGQSEAHFEEIFQRTELGCCISAFKEGERKEFFWRYLRDFILITMSVSSPDELEVLQWALLSCVDELKGRKNVVQEAVPLPWVHFAYHHFRFRLHNLSRIFAVCPGVLALLQQNAGKVLEIDALEMVLDVSAAYACIEMLDSRGSQALNSAWLQQVKSLQMPIELIFTDEYFQSCGPRCQQMALQVKQCLWKRVGFWQLDVDYCLPYIGSFILQSSQEVSTKFVGGAGKVLERASSVDAQLFLFTMILIMLPVSRRAVGFFFFFFHKRCNHASASKSVALTCSLKGHFTWLELREAIFSATWRCFADSYTHTLNSLPSVAIQKNASFRRMCDSFFLDLVSTVCFKDNSPPDQEVIQKLLSLLFVRKDAPQFFNSGRNFHTKCLSPFDESIDKNPVVRSVILKLLLKYSFTDVKGYLQDYLTSVEEWLFLEENDRIELYTLFINCLEDSIYEKSRCCTEQEKLAELKQESQFVQNCLARPGLHAQEKLTVKYLQKLARIRLCLDTAAQLLFERHAASGQELYHRTEERNYLQHIQALCTQSRNDWFRIYLVRRLCKNFGMELVQQFSKDANFSWVFPEEILQQQKSNLSQAGQIDRYLICGDHYRLLRNALGQVMIECKTDALTEALKKCKFPEKMQAVYLILAIFREITVLYGSSNTSVHPKPVQIDTVINFIRDTKILGTDELQQFADHLVKNSHPMLRVDPNQSSQLKALVEILIHAAAVLMCGRDPILEPLKNLAFNPVNMQNSYLPTMPEDMLSEAQTWQDLSNLRWYMCPNGHPCTVGECGQPMQKSRCVDCGAEIGGMNHMPVQGFQQSMNIVDRTQTGHVLGNPWRREAVVAPDREMSLVSFVLIRMLSHMAMLLGTVRSPQPFHHIIKPCVPNPTEFLLLHIEKDLQLLVKTLGKSADETSNVVHLILTRLLQQPQHPWPLGYDPTLSTKQFRNNWEKDIVHRFIMPEMKLLDRKLLDANHRISKDERVSSNPVVKIVYGDPMKLVCNLQQAGKVHCSAVWSCRTRISVEHLAHIVEQNDGRDTVPVLWRFLQKEAELRLVKFLPEILALQQELVKRFQNVGDAVKDNINMFLLSLQPESVRDMFRRRIICFIDLWNQLRTSLATNVGEIKIPEEYCAEDLNLNSTFEFLLPRRHGHGLCSTALVSYLIALQNEFVYAVEKHTKESNKYAVSPSDLSDLHVIKYEVERDLMPLILSNCQYSKESGGETLPEYDLPKIQQQISNRILQGKPLITLTGIPTLVYRQDRNYENIFRDINAKLLQEPLTASAISAVSGDLHSCSDVCDALSVVEVTLGFLAMGGGDGDMPLVDYIQDVLQMGDQTAPHVIEALSRCNMKHVIALWQLLSARKSERMLHLKRDPFEELNPAYKDELSLENTRLLRTFLTHSAVDTFVLELHEMMILKLKNIKTTEDFNPEWSLREMLQSVIDLKDTNILPELEESLTEDIPLAQCVAVWKAAVAFKQERLLR